MHEPGYDDEDGYELWLRYGHLDTDAIGGWTVLGDHASAEVCRAELRRAGLDEGPGGFVVGTRAELAAAGIAAPGDDLGDEGHAISGTADGLTVTADSPAALVCGTFHLLRLLQTHAELPARGTTIAEQPAYARRVLAHWDNLDGSIERGYSGTSLWRWDELPGELDPRYTDYARACASIGLNGTCLNNVNSDARILSADYLAKAAALADVFRPYGLRVWLAPAWSSPMQLDGLATADPGDPAVQAWWAAKADEIYALIPDFAGFQVKADSEGQPGPHTYGADHATGANALARALAPHGGTVLWRAFVYDTSVDADRAKCAYEEFTPLDGRFEPNVLLQVKNGPIDFQPREPFHPLFGAMARTPMALELQVTQEYLGHSTHLVHLGGMWEEILGADTYAHGAGSPVATMVGAIVGVANTGSDRNWCGHHLAQANWYTFGRLATDPHLSAEQLADEWIRMTWPASDGVGESIAGMMATSWPACVDYTTPLGLHHLSSEGVHYGPQPDLSSAAREDWNNTYFHRADSRGLGFDRSSTGSGATAQYHSPLRERFDRLATCPEELLLWFHHVAWDHRLSSGRTLIDELALRYARGVDAVAGMLVTWRALAARIDDARHAHVLARLEQQLTDAAEWRDVCTAYFRSFATGDTA